jgi:5-methylcytosine-specific restriction endonuclease McrA
VGHRLFRPGHKRQHPGRKFNSRRDWMNLYDHSWEKYRLRFLKENKLCYACAAPATVVDHIYAHRGDAELFKKLDNHLPLCSTCHNKVTALFDRKRRPTEEKIRWFNNMRLRLGITHRVRILPRYSDE